MENKTPSKVVIIPRPPVSSTTEDSNDQGPVMDPKSSAPASMPPVPETEMPETPEEEIDKTKLPQKPKAK
jgi:hypothetical protein